MKRKSLCQTAQHKYQRPIPSLHPQVLPPGGEHAALAPIDPRDRVVGNLPRLECLLDRSVQLHGRSVEVFNRVMPVGNDVRVFAESCHETSPFAHSSDTRKKLNKQRIIYRPS